MKIVCKILWLSPLLFVMLLAIAWLRLWLQEQELQYWAGIALAAQQAAVDRGATGDASIGWPGDVHAASRDGYLSMMERCHYIKKSVFRRSSVQMTSVMQADPEDTVFVWGKWGKSRWIVRKNCKSSVENVSEPGFPSPLPPRHPAVLPPRGD